MDLTSCHGNRYDVISTLKVLPNNIVAKIFIYFLPTRKSSFLVTFNRFTNPTSLLKHRCCPTTPVLFLTENACIPCICPVVVFMTSRPHLINFVIRRGPQVNGQRGKFSPNLSKKTSKCATKP